MQPLRKSLVLLKQCANMNQSVGHYLKVAYVYIKIKYDEEVEEKKRIS